MPVPGIQVAGLRAGLDAAALRERRFQLDVGGGTVRFSVEALDMLIPASVPLRVERIERGRGFLRASVLGLEPVVEVRPEVVREARVRFVPVSIRAGFLPLPGAVLDTILALARAGFPSRPGLYLGESSQVEIDL